MINKNKHQFFREVGTVSIVCTTKQVYKTIPRFEVRLLLHYFFPTFINANTFLGMLFNLYVFDLYSV
jgi:hypothetical protein